MYLDLNMIGKCVLIHMDDLNKISVRCESVQLMFYIPISLCMMVTESFSSIPQRLCKIKKKILSKAKRKIKESGCHFTKPLRN